MRPQNIFIVLLAAFVFTGCASREHEAVTKQDQQQDQYEFTKYQGTGAVDRVR